MRGGYKVVLTAGAALMSDYNGVGPLGFASAIPTDIMREWLAERLFPTRSDETGRMKYAPYGLAKIEAKLLECGFDESEVAIVDPRKLDRGVGPNTKVVGVSCLDPLGVNYGAGIVLAALRLMGLRPSRPPYMSESFMEVIKHPALAKYKPKVVLGGPGVWEVLDAGLTSDLGVDAVVEGEGETVACEIFKRAVEGRSLPKHVRGAPAKEGDIPVIRTPSRNGIVEITRGCGRGCRFCNPTLLAFRSIPKETILAEVKLNVEHGIRDVLLHSEDFPRYGAKGLEPEGDKLLSLLKEVKEIRGVRRVLFDFVTPSTVLMDPKLISKSAELVGNDKANPSYIEVGIETGSPRLLERIAPGKPRPYKPEEWQDVVEAAIGILNDNGWVVCGTMITGLPSETREDVQESLELLDRLKKYKIFLFVLPFVPSGSLRGREGMDPCSILKDPLRAELLAEGLRKSVKTLKETKAILLRNLPIHKRLFVSMLLLAASTYMERKLPPGRARPATLTPITLKA